MSTLYKSLQHAVSLFSLLCLHQQLPGNGYNNGYSSASVLKSSLNGGSTGWRPFHTNLLVFFSQPDFQLSTKLSGWRPRYIVPLHGPRRKHRFRQFLYCCMRIRCRGNMFTAQFSSSDNLFFLIKNLLPSSECCFAVRLEVATQQRLCTLQYKKIMSILEGKEREHTRSKIL
jgi:hypothetical protein